MTKKQPLESGTLDNIGSMRSTELMELRMFKYLIISKQQFEKIITLPKFNVAPENGPSQ